MVFIIISIERYKGGDHSKMDEVHAKEYSFLTKEVIYCEKKFTTLSIVTSLMDGCILIVLTSAIDTSSIFVNIY